MPRTATEKRTTEKKRTLNRIKQPRPLITGAEAFKTPFFNDRLQNCFKTVRKLTNLMNTRKKILAFALLAIILTASGAAQQNQSSSSVDPGLVPGDLFYPVESFVEDLEVSVAGFIGGEDFKAKAMANNAQEKLAEAEQLAEKNKSEKAAEMTEKYAEEMNRSRSIAEKNGNRNLSGQIDDISRKNVERLEEVRKKVPGKAGEKIEEAINRSKNKAGRRGPQKNPGNSPEKDKTQNSSGQKPELPEGGRTDKKNTSGNENAGNLSSNADKTLENRENDLNKTLNSSEPAIDDEESSENSQANKDSETPSSGSESDGETDGENENPLEKGGKGLL